MPPKGKKKFVMPTAKQFLERKKIYDEIKEPVWEFLEREMRENAHIKPYNEKVGNWLKFLKDLKWYKHCEVKRKERRLDKEVGPKWYFELSTNQRNVLDNMRPAIRHDINLDLPVAVSKALAVLGVTLKIPDDVLLNVIKNCYEDTGILMWDMFTVVYKHPPCVERQNYSMNARLLMSSIFFIDLKDCIERLEVLTGPTLKPPPPKEIKQKPNGRYDPNERFGVYKQTLNAYKGVARIYGKKPAKLPPFEYKVKLRSDKSMENIRMDPTFLERRKDRMQKSRTVERVCNYKFWEPPSTLRNSDPKMRAYIEALKMFKMKCKPKKLPLDNIQFQLQTVCYPGEHPRFAIQQVCYLPTGYIAINGGEVRLKSGEYVTNIHGFYKYPREAIVKCQDKCDCVQKWNTKAMSYVKSEKCTCGHYYDYKNEGKPTTETLFHPPTKHGSFWIDEAQVFNMDSKDHFIRERAIEAMRSQTPTPTPSHPTISATGLKPRELLTVFFADLADTHLMTPHLPDANRIHKLQEWCRRKVFGKYIPESRQHKMRVTSARRWLDLDHIDFKGLPFTIPFSREELNHLDFSHRDLIQKLCLSLLRNYEKRNQLKQLEQARLFWTTMHYDTYKGKSDSFLDSFYTYMPCRLKDTYVLRPYSNELVDRRKGGKACPLWW